MEDIAKFFGEILKGNIATPFIVILIIGFVRVATLLLMEKDKRLQDSQTYNEKITQLNESLTKIEVGNQESNKLLIAKLDGFMDGKK